MKKLFVFAMAGLSFAACNDNQTDNANLDADDTSAAVTTTTDGTMGNTGTMDTTTTGYTAYTPVEGDVTYENRKLRVRRNNEWVDSDNDVTLDDGTVIYRDGRAKRQNTEITLNDGEIVTRTGNFFDRTGQAIENAWDATKRGAKKAGNAVEKAADKVGEKAKKAVTDDPNIKDDNGN